MRKHIHTSQLDTRKAIHTSLINARIICALLRVIKYHFHRVQYRMLLHSITLVEIHNTRNDGNIITIINAMKIKPKTETKYVIY